MWISFLTVALSLRSRRVFGVPFVCGSLSNGKIRAIAEQRSNEKTRGGGGGEEDGKRQRVILSILSAFSSRPLPHPLLVWPLFSFSVSRTTPKRRATAQATGPQNATKFIHHTAVDAYFKIASSFLQRLKILFIGLNMNASLRSSSCWACLALHSRVHWLMQSAKRDVILCGWPVSLPLVE